MSDTQQKCGPLFPEIRIWLSPHKFRTNQVLVRENAISLTMNFYFSRRDIARI
jgi:hypothetical protein